MAVYNSDEPNMQGLRQEYGEANVFLAHDELKLLTANLVGYGPHTIIFLRNITLHQHPMQLTKDQRPNMKLLADHRVPLIVGVVGVAEEPVRSELEFEKLVAKATKVTNTAQVSTILKTDAVLVAKVEFWSRLH